MRLAAMRYKGYVWPHNPRTYTIDYRREMAVHKVPFGRYQLQDLGLTRRVMRGEGAFTGEGAYEEFKRLASVFYEGGPGPLIHPVWQASDAYFVDLHLRQEPRSDYVEYAFTFWEAGPEYAATVERPAQSGGAALATGATQYHTVAAGESLWAIAQQYGLGLNTLIGMNPQVKNPNLIRPGEQVRVR